MDRLVIHVEGQTEESFVNELIAPHLYNVGYKSVSARIMGNARHRARLGGIRPWSSARSDIIKHLYEDQGCISTTFVDYYGLPSAGERAWPGRAAAGLVPFEQKAALVESAMGDDLATTLGASGPVRFIAFVVMHEFEGLLFSDCDKFAAGIGEPGLANDLLQIRQIFSTPEHINDSPTTAPSKRIEALLPKYQKPLFGTLAALEIGLPAIRDACPLFSAWLSKLELSC